MSSSVATTAAAQGAANSSSISDSAAASTAPTASTLSPELSASIRSFYEHTTAPSSLPALRATLHAFLSNLAPGTRVAAVTSGGTLVPLEANMVRCVDNFSTGTRGAALVEHLLERGYAVVMLARRGSAVPFLRRIAWMLEKQNQAAAAATTTAATATTASSSSAIGSSLPPLPSSAPSLNSIAFLRALSVDAAGSGLTLNLAGASPPSSAAASSSVAVSASQVSSILSSVSRFQSELSGRLLSLEFSSVGEYLFSLRTLCRALRDVPPKLAAGAAAASSTAARQRSCMLLLAAAVSDYHIPADQLSVHKLQSRSGGALELRMEQTPKVLHCLRHKMAPRPAAAAVDASSAAAAAVGAGSSSASSLPAPSADPAISDSAWCPQAFALSFKLETDASLLVSKSRVALREYGVNVVCANGLHTRYNQLQLIVPPANSAVAVGAAAVSSATTGAATATPDDEDGITTIVRAPATPDQDEFAVELEVEMVRKLMEMHDRWIASA